MTSIFSSAKIKLDIRGLYCPDTVMIIRKTVRSMNIGEILFIITDDLTTKRDIPNFCKFMDHTLLLQKTQESPFHYLLRKGLL